MTDKELRKLKRNELLEIMIELEKENMELKKRLEAAESELESRRIALSEVGSIAEAALALNDVFDAAQRAADQYIENVKERFGNG